MVVDKRRHLRPLRIALYLNEQAPVVYRMLYGDKDTFLIAWRIADATASVVPHRPFVDERVLTQRDFSGAPLFQHRTGSKWSHHANQYRLEGFRHMESCAAFLADLRASWNGRQFFPPDRSLAACIEEERLAQAGMTQLVILGDRELDLRLLPGHQIGEGRSADRQNWYVVETGQGLELIIHSGDQISYRLRQESRGIWLGEKFSIPQSEVRLRETPDPLSARHYSGRNGLVETIVAASGVAAGAGGRAREQLLNALLLLLRAHPGLRDAIEGAAAGSPQIACVVEEVLARDAETHKAPIGSSTDVIQAGYLPAHGLRP
jgi:hypothetical protein